MNPGRSGRAAGSGSSTVVNAPEGPVAPVARLDELVERDPAERLELGDDDRLEALGGIGRVVLGAAGRLLDDDVDDPQGLLVGRCHLHGERRGGRLVRRPPQDRRAALRADDAVDRVLERDDDVADGDRERAARATLPGDDRHDRRPEAGHGSDRAGDGIGDAAFLGLGSGMGARDVDEGHDREAEPLGELHDPHRLAVALGMGHPEVAPDVLVRLGALLLADHDEPVAVDPGEARHDRLVVAERPVAVELHELIGHRGHELERVGALDVPGELDACPDGAARVGRLGGRAVGRRVVVPGLARGAAAQAVNHGGPPHRRCSGPIPPRWMCRRLPGRSGRWCRSAMPVRSPG